MITLGTTSMRYLWNRCLLVSALSLLGGAAQADPQFDVQVFVSDGKLATTRSLFDGFFMDYETDSPGFSNAPGGPALPTGVAYGFNVVGKLWYHSGVVGDPVSTAPGNPFIRIGDELTNVVVSQTSGPQPGLELTSSLAGSLHAHLPYTLLGDQRPVGVYGLLLEITSPSFTTSDPFVVALTNDPTITLAPVGVAYGEQAILAAALVPEPSALGLMATAGAAAGLAGIARRRRPAAPPTRAAA